MPTPHRRSLRVECGLPVHWVRHRHLQQDGEARLCNLHGMFIATRHTVPVNFIIDLTIKMPWGELSALVVPKFCGNSLDGHGMGVELRIMDLGDRELWINHYRRILEARAIRG